MIDPATIAELQRLLEYMSPRPWHTELKSKGSSAVCEVYLGDGGGIVIMSPSPRRYQQPGDASGIIALVNAAPDLLRELSALRGIVVDLAEADLDDDERGGECSICHGRVACEPGCPRKRARAWKEGR